MMFFEHFSKFRQSIKTLLCAMILAVGIPVTASFADIENEWGGHIKANGAYVRYDNDSYYSLVGEDTGFDGFLNTRLKDTLYLSDSIRFEAHYAATCETGESYKKKYKLRSMAGSFADAFSSDSIINDRTRLFDLSKKHTEESDYLLWSRMDRLYVSFKHSWGDIDIGRQASTWGNGLIFNAMDLFNPFAPSDMVRDYKTGDDLVSLRSTIGDVCEVDLLYIPRRDQVSRNVSSNQSSMAGKLHFFTETMEFDLMLARHYDETISGIGATGTLGGAAWRTDIVWSKWQSDICSTPSIHPDNDGYITATVNLDYSWVLFNKNMYGLIEYYHNGSGETDYAKAMTSTELMTRIRRGELFTLGKDYIATQLQVELHPLFNIYISTINNINDPSGIIQPRATLSISENATLDVGMTTYYGGRETEYGGYSIPGTSFYSNSPENIYFVISWYF